MAEQSASSNKGFQPEQGREEYHAATERVIADLKERIATLEAGQKKEPMPSAAGHSVEQVKKVKEEIRGYLHELQQTPSFASPVGVRDDTPEIRVLEKDQQVGALLSLVFDKGLPHALAVARALDNPALMDEFHDTLIDHYYGQLLQTEAMKSL
ncbi:MAG: hypothetical protein HYV78_00430 [Candidatus Wildermuthbacteria bacterium]|nr:hypothetical protein [Candidatus Wildermuthbacteria bacterium]